MDYEKKYKEAIERAKIWQEHLYDVNDKDYADELNFIFPELAESEDERMKKAIIATIHLYYGEPLEDKAKEMVAWLEKQVEKPTAEEILIKVGLKPYKDGDQWCILVGDNIQDGICGFGDTIEDALYEFLKEIIAL